MVTVEKHAQSISQTKGAYKTEKYYREWTNLNNLKSEDNWASCGVTSSNNNYTLIGGKTGTNPYSSDVCKEYAYPLGADKDIWFSVTPQL